MTVTTVGAAGPPQADLLGPGGGCRWPIGCVFGASNVDDSQSRVLIRAPSASAGSSVGPVARAPGSEWNANTLNTYCRAVAVAPPADTLVLFPRYSYLSRTPAARFYPSLVVSACPPLTTVLYYY